jgi:hypothetical protein
MVGTYPDHLEDVAKVKIKEEATLITPGRKVGGATHTLREG